MGKFYNSILDNSVDSNDWQIWVYGTAEFAGRIQSGYMRGFWMQTHSWYQIVTT
ncbi:MAG TPA: hypothetical protein VMW24_11405 [Sedimentisphaerales bacterium]|nr:hypothetical protein [Sedimentisphaerales bacterium]